MALVDAYLATDPPRNIRHVECRALAPLVTSAGDVLEQPLATVADLVYGEGEDVTIRELKTSARSYTQDQIDTALQATCYASLVHETQGVWPRVEYAVLTKTKTPRAQLLTTTRGLEDAGRLGDLVHAIERAIAAEVLYPIESPLNCSGCPYRAECRDWRPTTPDGQRLYELNQEPANGHQAEPVGC